MGQSYLNWLAEMLNKREHNFHGAPIIYDEKIVEYAVSYLKAIESIDARLFDIFVMRCKGHTLDEIATKHHVTRERIRQLLHQIDTKLYTEYPVYYPHYLIANGINVETNAIDVKNMPLDEFVACNNLQTRIFNGLYRNGIRSVSDLLGKSVEDLRSIPYFGEKMISELENALAHNGLCLRSMRELPKGYSKPSVENLDDMTVQEFVEQNDLPVRLVNSLYRRRVFYMSELLNKSKTELFKIPNLGRVSIAKLENALIYNGLALKEEVA